MILTINGRDISTLGLRVADQGTPWAIPQAARGLAPSISRVGVRPAAYSTGAPAVLNLSLALPADVSTRRGLLDTALSWLDGLLELEWADAPGRVQYARLQAGDVRARFESVAWIQGELLLPLQLVRDVPLSFDKQAYVVAIGTTAVALPLGTAASPLRFEFQGAITADVTITYRNISGTVLAQLVVDNPATSSGETLVVDGTSERIAIWTGTAFDDANELYESGSFPVADPGDGNREAAAWPTIEASNSGYVIYRRTWE
jgi:hypothetical protein